MASFLFAQQALQTAVVAAGRLILTGQVQNAGLTQSQFKTNDVCPLLPALFTCSNLYVNVQTYNNFSARQHHHSVADHQFQRYGQQYRVVQSRRSG